MINKKIKLTAFAMLIAMASMAGNKDRTGQAGAGELLINPWGASSGLFGLNVSNVIGVEALKVNVAGMAKIKTTEFGLAHNRYLAGTGIGISNVGVAHSLGDIGVIGVNLMSMSYGSIPITTENSPQGGIGNYKPNFMNLSIGLAHTFSKNMSTGISVTYVNEFVTNIKASAIGFDAGVQYTNGKDDNLHIGVTLKNVGTNLRFSGDGFSYTGTSPDRIKEISVTSKSDKFALPSQLSFGFSYDFYLKANNDTTELAEGVKPSKHRLTPLFSFISNSFNSDWLGIGAEYAFKEKFMARLAYRYEDDIFSKSNNTTFYSGLSGGVTLVTKLSSNEDAHKVAIDYGFRGTRISNGIHTVGLRMTLGEKGN